MDKYQNDLTDYQNTIYNIVKMVTKQWINEYKEDPLKVKDYIFSIVNAASKDYLTANYHKIVFDSPMGKDSAKLLQDTGFPATWEGKAGNRGNTIWYIPKSQVPELSSADTMLQCVDLLNKMNPDNRFQGLFDIYTSIELIED